MKSFGVIVLGLLLPLPLLAAQNPPPAGTTTVPVPPGANAITVNVNVAPATPAPPPVSIVLKDRHGHVYPHREGCCHTGGGYIDIAQATPDTVVITMTGIAVATGSPVGRGVATIDWDLDQCFEVSFDKEGLKAAKVSIEARVIGLLRSECKGGGTAEESNGCATILCDPSELLTLCVPPHSVGGGENLSINDHCGPVEAPIAAGKYKLHQVFHIGAFHPKSYLPCKPSSAEFAPDPALDPLWISYWESFHGIAKKDFGFQVTIHVAEDTSAPAATNGNGNGGDKDKGDKDKKDQLPPPKPDTKPDVKPDVKPELPPGVRPDFKY